MSSLHDLSALEQADAVRRHETSSADLVDHDAARIAEHASVGAFVTLTLDTARERATAADAAVAAGEDLPPLHGVLIGIKDLNLTQGVPIELGSPVYADFVPPLKEDVVEAPFDATLVPSFETVWSVSAAGLPADPAREDGLRPLRRRLRAEGREERDPVDRDDGRAPAGRPAGRRGDAAAGEHAARAGAAVEGPPPRDVVNPPRPGQGTQVTSDLQQLARAHGVATTYEDWAGKPVEVSAFAVTSALAALGVDAATPDAVTAALADVEAALWSRLLPPSVVLRGAGEVALHVEQDADVVLEVHLEDGSTQRIDVPGVVAARRGTLVRRPVPLRGLPLGWHVLTATAGGATADAVLCVAPTRIELPEGFDRAWGWMVQLYSLRSEQSWAMGDYADLRTVVSRAVADGAGALLLNPLHAETPVVPINPSPYSPSSRRFRAAIYLHVEDVPEYAAAPSDVRAAVDALKPVAEPDRIPRDPVWRAKLAALELLWPLHRAEDLAAWRAAQGTSLKDFAVFCALAEQHGANWQEWPASLRRPGLAAEAAVDDQRVDFWCWVQLLVDEQLAAITGLMVIHDLAVGVDAGGADAWALQDVLALGTTVGAPPDSFNQQGQDWGLPPWRPDRLAESGYLPFRDVVRGTLRHAGGLRIDHVMGLFRLWWVPSGSSAAEGTYVSYDADALLGVLALEASRAGALVVGEDLGTVEDRVRSALDATGVLGSAVLWFETSEDGAVVPPDWWRPLALASVTTHDLPTAAGFLAEEQVRVRDQLGQLGVPVEQERAKARSEREAILAVLESTGLLAAHDGDVVRAMHAMLAASPCRLVLAAFGDAVGDLRQPNLPGTVDEYPNWRLPVADGSGTPLSLEELLACDGVRDMAALLSDGTRPVR